MAVQFDLPLSGPKAAAIREPSGFTLLRGYFSREEQAALLADVLSRIGAAPFFRGRMPRTGTPLSVEMTNLGPLGWVSAVEGYSYRPVHPETGAAWGAMPQRLLDLWEALADHPAPPEACLVNWYKPGCKLGLHIDADEDAKFAPVVSVSLGDDALFRLGGPSRKDPTRSFRLQSGDVVVLGGASRRFFHGVDRIYAGTSDLVPEGGRINLTLRRVSAA
ncbi:MAG: alpha-ketoglutarate-dependent dioxygenase AlkB [Caulobacterales bacterium]